MKHLTPLWNFLGHNKYWIVIIIGVLIVGFIDENSLLQHARNRMEVRELNQQIEKYNARYEQDEKTLRDLQRNPEAITKIAREKYFMKTDDEDIFVLSDDDKIKEEKDETTE